MCGCWLNAEGDEHIAAGKRNVKFSNVYWALEAPSTGRLAVFYCCWNIRVSATFPPNSSLLFLPNLHGVLHLWPHFSLPLSLIASRLLLPASLLFPFPSTQNPPPIQPHILGPMAFIFLSFFLPHFMPVGAKAFSGLPSFLPCPFTIQIPGLRVGGCAIFCAGPQNPSPTHPPLNRVASLLSP
jgi:hypothetical protein